MTKAAFRRKRVIGGLDGSFRCWAHDHHNRMCGSRQTWNWRAESPHSNLKVTGSKTEPGLGFGKWKFHLQWCGGPCRWQRSKSSEERRMKSNADWHHQADRCLHISIAVQFGGRFPSNNQFNSRCTAMHKVWLHRNSLQSTCDHEGGFYTGSLTDSKEVSKP